MNRSAMLQLEGFTPAFGPPCGGIWTHAQLVALDTARDAFSAVTIAVPLDCAHLVVPTRENATTLVVHPVHIRSTGRVWSNITEHIKVAYVTRRLPHLPRGSFLVYFELDFAFPPTAALLMGRTFEAAGLAWSVLYTCRRFATRWGSVNSGLVAYRAGTPAVCVAAHVASKTPPGGQYQRVVDALAKNASDAPAVPLHKWKLPAVVRVAACPHARLALVEMRPLNVLEGNCTREHIVHYHSYHKAKVSRCCRWERAVGRAKCAWA